jgi:hypothetical protein
VDAQCYISNFADRHPGLFKSIQTKQAAHMLLNEQKLVVDKLYHEGSINAEEHTEIREDLDVKINNLDHEYIEWEDWDQSTSLLMICPHFPKLQGPLLTDLESKKKLKLFEPGQHLLKTGDPVNFYPKNPRLQEYTLSPKVW